MTEESRTQSALRVTLSDAVFERMHRVAGQRGITSAQFCVDAIQQAVLRFERCDSELSKSDNARNHEAWLKSIIRDVLRRAQSWSTFDTELRRCGIRVVAAGGGVTYAYGEAGATRIKASAVGPGYSALVRKFRAPMPGHPHRWIAERVLESSHDSEIATEEDALVYFEQ